MRDGVILLVEDNTNDEALTLLAMKKNNILNEVTVVRDGAEALDYLFAQGPYAGRKGADLPELVLLDLNLPKIGGLDVLKRIRSDVKTRLLPIVILTSSKEDVDVFAGYGLGANSYVVKPVDFTQFQEAVKHLGIYWLLVNTRPPRVD